MLPKLNNCIDAIEHGVSRVHILDGRIAHCLLLEIFTNKGIGTAIINKEAEKLLVTVCIYRVNCNFIEFSLVVNTIQKNDIFLLPTTSENIINQKISKLFLIEWRIK